MHLEEIENVMQSWLILGLYKKLMERYSNLPKSEAQVFYFVGYKCFKE